ncbi:MAG: M28 family peptidase [Bacteroidetes bacterium]|nr:MAG: M28 family peptidase [Bacteroidota bacterium]
MKALRLGAGLLLLYGQSPDSTQAVRFLQKEVRRLCRFEGRAPLTPGGQKAEAYLIKRLRQMGYSPQRQAFSLSVYQITLAKARTQVGRQRKPWKLGADFLPAADCPPLHGEWLVDTLPREGYAWWVPTPQPLGTVRQLARAHRVAVVIYPLQRLVGSIALEPDSVAVVFRRQDLPQAQRISLRLKGRLVQGHAANVWVKRAGQRTDSAWVVGAHYDHLGRMGSLTFWGANDNASGTALLLLLAQRLAQSPPPPYDVYLVAFTAEELGLIGSQAWVMAPPYPLAQLRGMLNLDLVGFGEKGVAVVGGSDQPAFWERINRVRVQQGWNVALLVRPNAPNSDHYPFREKGVPALFFYLQGGPGYYHDGQDRPPTLTWQATYPLLRWIEGILFSP